MLKKIEVDQLRIGMHLKEFCGSWMDHPFWRTGFVLTDPTDIKTILASNIKEVWIDNSHGLDIVDGEVAISEAESDAQIEQQMQQAARANRVTAPISTALELERAAKICHQSKQAVISMFQEARMGKAVDVGGAQKMVEEIT